MSSENDNLTNIKNSTKEAAQGLAKRHGGKVFLVITLVFVYLSYQLYLWSTTQSTDNAYVEAKISDVSPEVSGVLSKILVQENEHVTKDQEVAHIDDAVYVARLKKADSALASAEQNIAAIEQNIKLSEVQHAKAKLALENSEENLEIIEREFKRANALGESSYASQKYVDSVAMQHLNAQSKQEQDKLAVDMCVENIKLLNIQLLDAKTKYSSALADQALAQRDLDHTVIRAPIDGVLTNSALRKGKLVQPGRVIFSVVPLNKLYVKANFKETQIARFEEGMDVVIYVDAFGGHKINGKIRNLFPATGAKFSVIPPQNTSGNFTKIVQRIPVVIDMDLPDELQDRVIPGMSCFVKIRP